MNAAMLQRYSPGGDIYASLRTRYGYEAAEDVSFAAKADFASGENGEVASTLARIRNGPPLNDSATEIFFDQITTDPLAAPLDAANRQLGNAAFAVLRNPWVVLAVVVVVLLQFPAVRKWVSP